MNWEYCTVIDAAVIDDSEFDEDNYAVPREVQGFSLPPEEGYVEPREWLATTWDTETWTVRAIVLVKAVDPCALAQRINVEQLLRLGATTDPHTLARLQDVRILMELDDWDMVWRVESILGNIRTMVQPSDHMDALEDVVEHASQLARRSEADICIPITATLISMRTAMAESAAVDELVDTVRSHSEAYEDAEFHARYPKTWGGLAESLALAEILLASDDPFLVEYRTKNVDLAEALRPGLGAYWQARKDERLEKLVAKSKVKALYKARDNKQN